MIEPQEAGSLDLDRQAGGVLGEGRRSAVEGELRQAVGELEDDPVVVGMRADPDVDDLRACHGGILDHRKIAAERAQLIGRHGFGAGGWRHWRTDAAGADWGCGRADGGLATGPAGGPP